MKLNVCAANNHQFIQNFTKQQVDLIDAIQTLDPDFEKEALAFMSSTAMHAAEVFKLIVDKWLQIIGVNGKFFFIYSFLNFWIEKKILRK